MGGLFISTTSYADRGQSTTNAYEHLQSSRGSSHFSRDIPFVADHNNAYAVGKGKMELGFLYYHVNQSLDFFGITDEQEKDSATEFLDFTGNVGELDSRKVIYNFGFSEHLSLLTKLGETYMQYGAGTVDISHTEMALRWSFRQRRKDPQISLEIRAKQLRGSGFEDRFQQIVLEDVGVLAGNSELSADVTVIRFDEPQTIRFSGLGTESGTFQLAMSKQLLERLYLHSWLAYEQTVVFSEIEFSLGNFGELDELANRLQHTNYFGVGADWRFADSWLFHLSLKSATIRRESSVKDAVTTNNWARSEFSWLIGDHWQLGLQAHYFENFLAGEVPFLLNEKTAPIFENSYGYLGISVLYQFGYGAEGNSFFVGNSGR